MSNTRKAWFGLVHNLHGTPFVEPTARDAAFFGGIKKLYERNNPSIDVCASYSFCSDRSSPNGWKMSVSSRSQGEGVRVSGMWLPDGLGMATDIYDVTDFVRQDVGHESFSSRIADVLPNYSGPQGTGAEFCGLYEGISQFAANARFYIVSKGIDGDASHQLHHWICNEAPLFSTVMYSAQYRAAISESEKVRRERAQAIFAAIRSSPRERLPKPMCSVLHSSIEVTHSTVETYTYTRGCVQVSGEQGCIPIAQSPAEGLILYHAPRSSSGWTGVVPLGRGRRMHPSLVELDSIELPAANAMILSDASGSRERLGAYRSIDKRLSRMVEHLNWDPNQDITTMLRPVCTWFASSSFGPDMDDTDDVLEELSDDGSFI